jgi:hypothetical protein
MAEVILPSGSTRFGGLLLKATGGCLGFRLARDPSLGPVTPAGTRILFSLCWEAPSIQLPGAHSDS